MAVTVTNGYTSIDDARARLRFVGTDRDDQVARWIMAASEAIREETGRAFHAATATRYYQAERTLPPSGASFGPPAGYYIDVDDLLSVTTLKTDPDGDRTYNVTWSASTDYFLEPSNAAADGEPYTRIAVDFSNGAYRFPTHPRGVQVVGSWGYCATGSHPERVREACLRIVAGLAAGGASPQGMMALPEAGLVVLRQDQHIMDLLAPFKPKALTAWVNWESAPSWGGDRAWHSRRFR